MDGIIIFLILLPSNKYTLKRRDIFSFEYSNGQNCTYKYEDYFLFFFSFYILRSPRVSLSVINRIRKPNPFICCPCRHDRGKLYTAHIY